MSRKTHIYLFAACAFFIHVWSIFNLLKEVPAWILRLNLWDLVAVIAYTQIYALVESLIVFLMLVFLSLALPLPRNETRFVAQISLVIVLTAAWVVLAHSEDEILSTWGIRQFLPWILMYSLSLIAALFIVYRSRTLEKLLLTFVERITVLSFIYVFVDLLSVFVVIIRNI